MNKEQVVKAYINLLSCLGMESKEVVLSAGAALVIFGIRDTTSDLDVDVPVEVFERLRRCSSGPSRGFERVMYSPGIDLHVLSPERVLAKHTVFGEEVYTYTLTDLGKQKHALLSLVGRREYKKAQDRADLFFIESTLYTQA